MGPFRFLKPADPKPPGSRTESILRKHLDRDFTVFPMAEQRPTQSQVRAKVKETESLLGIRYPREFIEHLADNFPGIFIEVTEQIWPRPKAFEAGPFWSFLYALHTYTSAPESEGWMRLDIAAKTFQEQTGLVAAPVLRIVGDADLFCTNAEGRIVRFDHELGELVDEDVEDFWALFDRELGELRARKDRKKAAAQQSG